MVGTSHARYGTTGEGCHGGANQAGYGAAGGGWRMAGGPGLQVSSDNRLRGIEGSQ